VLDECVVETICPIADDACKTATSFPSLRWHSLKWKRDNPQ
jgi:hypothetical protein